MYFSHFIAKQESIFIDICFKQGTQFCSASSSIGLIYYGPANWSFRKQIHAQIILLLLFTIKFFCIFFPNQFLQKFVFFCVLALENEEAFSESCSLISGVLQGLVKICKKYVEVNNFLLLIFSFEKYLLVQGFFNYSTRRQSIVFQSSLVVLFEGKLLEWR